MQDERRKIHDMLAAGRLTPGEAESQLSALARNAEQPPIDVGDGTAPPTMLPPPPGRLGRLKARFWKKQYVSTYVMLAPLLAIMIASAVLLFFGATAGLIAVFLAVPAFALQLIWNHMLVPGVASRPISLVEAYGIALVLALLMQGTKWTLWRR
jgi:hypothetical protein